MLVTYTSMAPVGSARALKRRKTVEASRRTWEVTFAGIFALAVGMLALVVAAPTAQAEEKVCRGTIGAKTVDNVRVPSGATCTLNSTRVEGTIKVENNATLLASGVRVKGNIQSEGFEKIRLNKDSRVVGSVQLKNGQSGGLAKISFSRINGDLQFESNDARMVANNNTVGANLQAVQNEGGVELTGNTIAENLQCKEDEPPPTGGGNTAGDKEDQCADL